MKKFLSLSVLIICFLACKNDSTQKQPDSDENLKPLTNTKKLTSNFMNWWTYQYNNIVLASDFIALDENSNLITKERFLQKLTSGKFIPVEMETKGEKTYELFIIPSNADKDISSTISNVTAEVYELYKWEGKKFPDFELVDLEGKKYDNESLIDKTTIIKTWFIACKPCVAEMPELNELVSKYQGNDKYEFLSLALDDEESLKKFLEKTEFHYAVAAEQKKLIVNQLKLSAYPRHIVINENGEIEKIFGKASDLITYLENHKTVKAKSFDSEPPPPPTNEKVKNDA